MLVVCMIVMLDWLLGGWLLINVVIGGDLVENVGDGIYLDYVECYEVMQEFLDVYKVLLVGEMVNYYGKYLKIDDGKLLFVFL